MLKRIFLHSFLLGCLFGYSSGWTQVFVDPCGFAIQMNEGDVTEVELTLNNDGDNDFAFKLEYEWQRDEELDRRMPPNGGPHRDALGDLIAQFQRPIGDINGYVGGIAWDWTNEWMWLTELETQHASRCMAVDPNQDFRVVATFNTPGQMMDAAWHEDVLYCVNWSNNWLFRFDARGNNLGNLNFNFRPTACGASQENNWLFVMDDAGNKDIRIFDLADNMREIGVINTYHQFTNNELCRSVLWVDQHPRGQLWMASSRADNNGQNIYELVVDTENWRVTEQLQTTNHWRANIGGMGCWGGLGHDGENLWTHQRNEANIHIIDDGVIEFRMLTFDVDEGVVRAQDSELIFATINPEGYEAGVYHILIGIYLTEPEQRRDDIGDAQILLSAVISLESPTADLSGTVTDAADNSAVPGTLVEMDSYVISRVTNRGGRYVIDNLPLGIYNLAFTAPDYLPMTRELRIEEAGQVELNVALLHSECVLDPNRIITQLPPGGNQDFGLTLSNTGNGPLTFTTERRLLGDANAESWELRRSYPISEIAGDPRIAGVAFLNDHFYVTGHAAGQHLIYVLDREGNITDRINQLGQSQYGMQDLAWDGEWLWGSGERRIFGFTPDGQQQVVFDGL
ncbi:MAG: carboxypeptidase regulatory-like domain-containing protein, partial [Calditrichota bacterium]